MKKISELSNEDLIKSRKILLVSTGVLGGLLLVLFAVTVYSSITKGFNAMIAIPFALSPMIFINMKRASDIKKELQARGIDV